MKLYIKSEKYQFHVQEISFLEYLINEKGIYMNPVKMKVIIQ